MRPDESMRITCLELAIKSGEWKGPGRSLTSAALAIEEYVTGKAAIELAKLAQPALLTDAQKGAVRQIVAEMLSAMFEGADARVRDAIAGAIMDNFYRPLTGVANTTDQHAEASR